MNGLILYTFWQNNLFDKLKILIYSLTILILLLFVNLLPSSQSDSINIALIHMPLFLWCLFGLSYVSFDSKNIPKRIEFIRFNGELIIMTGLILLAGGLMTGITLGLFTAIQLDIKTFYIPYIAITGGVAAPIVSYFLIRLFPNITSKIAPVIATLFTPLVLVTLVVYLISMLFSESKILEDRNLLLLLNAMLIAVMAIIVFSATELNNSTEKNIHVLILLILAALAIIINSIALIAIITRVANGLTPNRTVVLVSNILIFINLILLTRDLYLSYFRKKQLETLQQTVARYLSIYFGYTIIVIFVLPFIFGFK
jgi:hypothetical protein